MENIQAQAQATETVVEVKKPFFKKLKDSKLFRSSALILGAVGVGVAGFAIGRKTSSKKEVTSEPVAAPELPETTPEEVETDPEPVVQEF